MKCIDEGFGRNPSLERFARLHCFQLFIFGLDLFTEIKEPLRAPGRRHIRLHCCGQQQYAHGFETCPLLCMHVDAKPLAGATCARMSASTE